MKSIIIYQILWVIFLLKSAMVIHVHYTVNQVIFFALAILSFFCAKSVIYFRHTGDYKKAKVIFIACLIFPLSYILSNSLKSIVSQNVVVSVMEEKVKSIENFKVEFDAIPENEKSKLFLNTVKTMALMKHTTNMVFTMNFLTFLQIFIFLFVLSKHQVCQPRA